MDRGDEMRGGERARWMDGGEWADEVSEGSNADQQWTRRGAEEVEERRGLHSDGKVFWQATLPTGAQLKLLAMTHPAPPESNLRFISSNKIALTHCLYSIFVSFLPPDLSQVVSNGSVCPLRHSSFVILYL